MNKHKGSLDTYISTEDSSNKFKEYPFAIYNVAFFFLYSLANSAYLVTFAPIVDLTAETYDTSMSHVYLAYSLTAVGYLLLALPTNKSIENKGVKITIQMSVGFLIVGLFLRLLLNKWGFIFALIGNLVASLGRACSTNACTKVSVKWFLPKNRPLISSILLLGAPLGTILGYQITTFFISDPLILMDKEKRKSEFFSLMLWEAVILIVMIIPAALFYRDDPPTPTSAASGKKKVETEAKDMILKLLHNNNYLFIWFYVSVQLGIYALISAACASII